MAYQTRWVSSRQEQCIEDAEKRVLKLFNGAPFFGFAYRFDEVTYAGPLDEYDMPTPGSHVVELEAFVITKVTPKGFWVNRAGICRGRFILIDARKKYAHQTIPDAKESFLARKRRQIAIYQAKITKAEDAICMLTGRLGGL